MVELNTLCQKTIGTTVERSDPPTRLDRAVHYGSLCSRFSKEGKQDTLYCSISMNSDLLHLKTNSVQLLIESCLNLKIMITWFLGFGGLN